MSRPGHLQSDGGSPPASFLPVRPEKTLAPVILAAADSLPAASGRAQALLCPANEKAAPCGTALRYILTSGARDTPGLQIAFLQALAGPQADPDEPRHQDHDRDAHIGQQYARSVEVLLKAPQGGPVPCRMVDEPARPWPGPEPQRRGPASVPGWLLPRRRKNDRSGAGTARPL